MTLPANPRAVVTGAASGLGRAFCVRLGARGARILMSDIDTEGLAETERLALAAGAVEVRETRCDVSAPEEVAALAREMESHFGGTDLLVNNAGLAVTGPVEQVPLDAWRLQIDVNLYGVIYGCHAFLPAMKRAGAGAIINVASAAGLLSGAEMGPYNVTKAGVVALSETLSGELAGSGVSVTVLCPTFFKTNVARNAKHFGAGNQLDLAEKLMERSALTAEDVAELALVGAERGTLYVVPHADGRWMWRTKRAIPELFHRKLGPSVMKLAGRFKR